MTIKEFKKLIENVPEHAELLVGRDERSATTVLVETRDDGGNFKTWVTVSSKFEPER